MPQSSQVHGHHHQPGKSETFSKEFLSKTKHGHGVYDSTKVAEANDHIAASVRAGNALLVNLAMGPVAPASDGSGTPAIVTVTEYKFPHGVPTETVGE